MTGLPCGYPIPSRPGERCDMPEAVHRDEHPFQPYDRRTHDRRADAPAGEEERRCSLLGCPEPFGHHGGAHMELTELHEAQTRAASAPPASPEPLREALDGLPRLWWCGQWQTLNATRYHGNDGPCPAGRCGEIAYVRDSALRAALATATTAPVETAPDERLREALTEWQTLATDYSEALLRLGHHQRSRHESPQQYDSESSLACTAPGCLAALNPEATREAEQR